MVRIPVFPEMDGVVVGSGLLPSSSGCSLKVRLKINKPDFPLISGRGVV